MDEMFCEHGAPRGGACRLCDEGAETKKLTPEMEQAIISTLYHHPFGGQTILEMLTKREFSSPPSSPTDEQRKMAHETVEELLKLHYTALNEAMKEVTGEELEGNPYI